MTPAGQARLKYEEGYRQFVYKDTRGFASIAYGCNLDAGISPAVASAMLLTKLTENVLDIVRVFPWFVHLSPNRQDVIEDMVYQMGIEGVKKFPHMIAAIVRQDWQAAADEMLDSEWFKETPSRAKALADDMRVG